jgi:hypothetical protein
MDDEFLTQLYEAPDAEFARQLRRKLAGIQPAPRTRLLPAAMPAAMPAALKAGAGSRKIWLAGVAVLLILLALAVASIQPVRAWVQSVLVAIAGQSFEVTDDYPGDNYPGQEMIIEPEILPLAEALARFTHPVRLPSEMPAGYALDETNVRVYTGPASGPFADTIELEWVSAGGKITLRVSTQAQDISEIVAPGSLEEVWLDDRTPAALIRGGWDADAQAWSRALTVLRLRWELDGLSYDLMGSDAGGHAGGHVEQLILVASSTLR